MFSSGPATARSIKKPVTLAPCRQGQKEHCCHLRSCHWHSTMVGCWRRTSPPLRSTTITTFFFPLKCMDQRLWCYSLFWLILVIILHCSKSKFLFVHILISYNFFIWFSLYWLYLSGGNNFLSREGWCLDEITNV